VASVFALVNIVMLRDVPFPEPDRLIAIRMQDAQGMETGLSYPDFLAVRQQITTVESLAADYSGFVSVSETGQPAERFRAAWISADTFRFLRIPPFLGRNFLPSDDVPGAPLVLLIGYDVWQRRFGADPAGVGRAVQVDDVPAVIVGVMPFSGDLSVHRRDVAASCAVRGDQRCAADTSSSRRGCPTSRRHRTTGRAGGTRDDRVAALRTASRLEREDDDACRGVA